MMNMDALAARIKAKREATGLGLNVRFINESGVNDEWSFATVERANAFRAKLARNGRVVLA